MCWAGRIAFIDLFFFDMGKETKEVVSIINKETDEEKGIKQQYKKQEFNSKIQRKL